MKVVVIGACGGVGAAEWVKGLKDVDVAGTVKIGEA